MIPLMAVGSFKQKGVSSVRPAEVTVTQELDNYWTDECLCGR